MGGEIDPDEWVVGVEELPGGGRIIWRRCPICFRKIFDAEGSIAGFTAHLGAHGLKVKKA